MGEKLITLKEASEISGYSADYIGQLIRAGKIPGKQVYTNITWMTTPEAVLAHKSRKENGQNQTLNWKDSLDAFNRRIRFEFNLIGLFLKTFRSILPVVIVAIFSFFIFVIIIFNLISEKVSSYDVSPSERVQPFSY